ncbi:MAG: outer membrane protein assembly factor BamD [Planctomycetes bacterium]|nr:outer membrane protein assembly factor BamD [Planctomycetota bacterium]
MPPPAPRTLVAVLALAAAGCATRTDPDPGRPYQSPNAVSGGTRGGGRPAAPSLEAQHDDERALAEKKAAEAKAARDKSIREADALWAKAQAEPDPDDAADLYREIYDDHKESEHAEEAKWMEGVKAYEAGEWSRTITVLDEFTRDHPAHPHLADAERMLYDASIHEFDRTKGFLGVFRSDKKAYDGLNAIVERFPQGSYPDDALLALGDAYLRADDPAAAALQYKNLLLRYPDSEWSFQARLRLGDAYLARDQGTEYHAGYVDLDPRQPVTPQAQGSRPVRSCVEAALESYEAFLARLEADPARAREYAAEVAYARERASFCRSRLADKDRSVAAWYAGRGEAEAASTYERFAQNVEAGRRWSDGVAAAPAPRTTPPPAPPAVRPPTPPPPTPPPAPRVVTPAPPTPPTPPPAPRVVAPPPTPAPRVIPTPPPTPPVSPPPPSFQTPTATGPSGVPPPAPGTLPPPRRRTVSSGTP